MNKEQLLAKLVAEVHTVEVKSVGTMYFKVMTGTARDAFQKALADGDKTNSFFEATLVALTVVDANGQPMFSQEDVATLRDTASSETLSTIAKVVMRVNKLGAEAEAEAAGN